MKKINIEAFQKAGLSYKEIEGIKRGLDDLENGRVVSFDDVKLNARKEIFSKQKRYV